VVGSEVPMKGVALGVVFGYHHHREH
jgi:hypothetical protein